MHDTNRVSLRSNRLWVSNFTYVATEPSTGSVEDNYDSPLAETINDLYIHRRGP